MRGCEVSTPAFPLRPPAARAGPGPARPPPPPSAPSFRPLSAGRGRGGSPRSQGWLSAGPGLFSPLGPKAPAPRPDSAGVEISPSGIVGLLYQPSDKDRCEPTPLISRSFVFFASPRPPREVWQVRGQQSGWKSSPPPASFLRKNGRLGSAAKHPASPGALCHRRFCQSSIGAMKTPCPAAVFPLDTFRDPPLCRAPGKLRGWFSRSGEGGGVASTLLGLSRGERMGVPGLGLTMLGRNKCPVLVACSHGEAHPAGRPPSRWESGAAWLAGRRAGTSGSGANTWKCVPRLPRRPQKAQPGGVPDPAWPVGPQACFRAS